MSTRNYKKILPQVSGKVGISKSSVSLGLIEARAKELRQLCEKWLEDFELLVIYLDGMVFPEHHIIAAVGVDRKAYKHILGLAQCSRENAAVCVDLLQDIVKRGVDPQQKLLFVIDGSKALRSAINQIFGDQNPSAAGNLLEGMEEMFTLNHLGLPPTLTRCLAQPIS
jgi:putative transposase